MLLHGGSKDFIPVSFQNPHSVYAYWCMSPNVKQIQREEFFVKVGEWMEMGSYTGVYVCIHAYLLTFV
jgi:hypothetical protein